MEEFPFYAYLNRMKYINRWGLMRNTINENIQEHSLQTAMLAHSLAVIKNRYFGGSLDEGKVCLYAMFHDANEIITGDLPTPVKYDNSELQESYRRLEDLSKEKLLAMLPEEWDSVYRPVLFYEEMDPAYYPVVKAADKLSAYIKCVEEGKAGNSEFRSALESIGQSMDDMKLPELDYFRAHFLPAFHLTLDEMLR